LESAEARYQSDCVSHHHHVTGGTELAANRRMSFKASKAINQAQTFDKVLRSAGQSFRAEIERLSEEGLIPFLLFSFAFWIVSAIAWMQKFAGANPDPRFWTFLSLIVTAYGGLQVFRLHPIFRNFPLRERSEQRVAAVLDRLRWAGFIAFHDLANSGLNVDHVVVGPSGIYAIETKARRGSGTIDHASDHELIFGGRIIDGRPLRQTQNAARAVHRLLTEHLDQAYLIKPVLVFCGAWRIQGQPGDFAVDVVTPDQLQDYFERQQPKLTAKEIAEICSHLERPDRLSIGR
jgi:Nuclease-related domain